MLSIFLDPPLQKINHPIAIKADVELYILRLDLMHPQINGNKWFKLKYNLLEAKATKITTILTFGGAYSNHIFATAVAGKLNNLQTIGIIRGEEHLPLNSTLQFAISQGMKLIYVDRKTYKQRNNIEFQNQLQEQLSQLGEIFIIPEGGSNLNGLKGCTEILSLVSNISKFSSICLACGTGTTLAGMALSLTSSQRIIGFPVLKGGEFLNTDISHILSNYQSSELLGNWQLVCNYHFGGYGKVTQELINFCDDFYERYHVPLDYVYTGKMMYGVIDLINQGFFHSERLLLIHTGGLRYSGMQLN
ncbi:1-aminocyclopropane-1-carboxylate deaminase/D-cysteine desulfhydrase [Anabaena sp. FACHB-1237]|uniref:1-aminocyclopropane-1-carboxylate deaminase/D-cysteine desulfhydrase n=1 Tax=Anabaena sp. FACHB-1237 TaxID=2692769 RepID=UPI0016805D5D|nr:1-aminocyclopropane-1-carboxylate deaminase/D-cysteine desulfhydrase [Anabaena sp. FACHB-1237]MBD2139611.1 1-aminocyclopropane-1-carboxylate deaminase/D-cysteine desulfhydrase [Anabaena sp. FACHB-1237]